MQTTRMFNKKFKHAGDKPSNKVANGDPERTSKAPLKLD